MHLKQVLKKQKFFVRIKKLINQIKIVRNYGFLRTERVFVLQKFVFDSFQIPFEFTVIFSILLIWIYTHRGGIKTIVWTDTLQTTFMILSVILTIYFINQSLNWSFIEFIDSNNFKKLSRIFN